MTAKADNKRGLLDVRFHKADTSGIAIQSLPANDEREIDAAFAKLGEIRADTLLIGPGPFLDSRREKLIALACPLSGVKRTSQPKD